MSNNLNFFFNPKSIAVIGASRDPKKLGFLMLSNLKKYGYRGKVFPVNPEAKEILGFKVYENVLKIKEKVDLALISIPALKVVEALEECGRAKVKGAIIISAGFKETGEEGKEREEKIKEISKKYNIRVLGPNCLGLINTFSNLNASFAESMPEKWDIAVFSQSGAMCSAILDWANANGIGFSNFVSLGNKVDVSETDLLEVWADDEKTKVVLGYLEGIEDGEKFLKLAKKITKKKPFVVIKSGSSDEGARAISSHTGSLAGFDQATEAAFKKAGIIRARTIEDLFDASKIFSLSPKAKGNRIAVVTNAGGPGVMATDAIDSSKILEMANLSESTKKILTKALPSTSNVKNPIDVIGDALADRFEISLKTVVADPNVDIVLVILTPQVMTEVEKTAQVISRIKKVSSKPIVASFIGGVRIEPGIEILEKGKVPTYLYPERAIKSLEYLWTYAKGLKFKEQVVKGKLNYDTAAAREIISSSKQGLTEVEVSGILGAYGVSVSHALLAKDEHSAVRAAMVVGYPNVLKIASPNIIHKMDIGGVRLNLKNAEEVKDAFTGIIKSAKEHYPNAKIKGVTVLPMINEGQEVIIGAKRDDVFGPLLMFGLGGIYVEALKDVVFQICPVSREDARKMVTSIRTAGLLTGFRGQDSYDIEAIVDTIVRVSGLMMDFPEIKELDINPLRVYAKGQGAMVLDSKVILS